MDLFLLNEQQKMILETARDFAQKEVKPLARELDETGRFPKEIIEKMSELGFMGIYVPEEYGGSGLDMLSYVLALEEISKACASTGVIMSVNNSLFCSPLLKFGNEKIKNEVLKKAAQGKILGCFALSEPGNGSDAVALKTTAKKVGNKYILNGTKNFITNGKEADYCIVFATIDPTKKHKGVCAFLVDTKTKGFVVSKLEHKLGINASSTAQIHLDNVEVPEENLLGEEGLGFKIAMQTLDGGRIGIAAQAVGIAEASLEAAKNYAKTRKAFGTEIANHQAIQFKLADMSTKVEAAKLLTLNAAALKDAGKKYVKEAAMAKLYASKVAVECALEAVQIHGGYGYVREYLVERFLRDAKITEIYEGTSEIQRVVIARELLKD